MDDSHLHNSIRYFKRLGVDQAMYEREAAEPLMTEADWLVRDIHDLEDKMITGKSLSHRTQRYKVLLKERKRRLDAEEEEEARYRETLGFTFSCFEGPALRPGEDGEGSWWGAHPAAAYLEVFYPTQPGVPSGRPDAWVAGA